MKTENETPRRRGYYFAKSASGYVGCVHRHRTYAAARKCADGIDSTARVVFVPTGEGGFPVRAPEEVTS